MSVPRRRTYPIRKSDEDWEASQRLKAALARPHPTPQRSVTGLLDQGLNPYLDHWIARVNGDPTISAEALTVAKALSRSVGIGRVVLTDWQCVNSQIGRERRDPRIHSHLRDLQTAGYLGRHHSRGWQIQLPEENRD